MSDRSPTVTADPWNEETVATVVSGSRTSWTWLTFLLLASLPVLLFLTRSLTWNEATEQGWFLCEKALIQKHLLKTPIAYRNVKIVKSNGGEAELRGSVESDKQLHDLTSVMVEYFGEKDGRKKTSRLAVQRSGPS